LVNAALAYVFILLMVMQLQLQHICPGRTREKAMIV